MAATARRRPRATGTDEDARVLASSLRLRILRACLGEARTNKEIAQILDRDPATVLHHVRRLVDAGFLAAQEARRGARGSREIPYRATGRSWTLDLPGSNNALLDTFAEEVALVPIEQVRSVRMGLRLGAEDLEEFEDRLHALVEEFFDRSEAGARPDSARPDSARPDSARPDNADRPPRTAWSLFVALHPDPNRP